MKDTSLHCCRLWVSVPFFPPVWKIIFWSSQHCSDFAPSLCAHRIVASEQQNTNKAKFLLWGSGDSYVSNAERARYFCQNTLFWKAQEQQYLWAAIRFFVTLALLARLYVPNAGVVVGSRSDLVRTNLFPQPFFVFFVDARFPVRKQGARWKWMVF